MHYYGRIGRRRREPFPLSMPCGYSAGMNRDIIFRVTVIGLKKERISFTYENGTPSAAKADFSTDEMVIEYARDNGQVKAVKVGADNYVNKDDAQSGTFIIKTSGTEYTSELWYATGKVITTN